MVLQENQYDNQDDSEDEAQKLAKLTSDYASVLDQNLSTISRWALIRRILFSPLELIRRPLSLLVGVFVLPAGTIFYKPFDVEAQNVAKKFGITVSKCLHKKMIGSSGSLGFFKKNAFCMDDFKDRKIVVMMSGNARSTLGILSSVNTMNLKLRSGDDRDRTNPDLYAINHLAMDWHLDLNKEKTIYNACAHIKRLLDAGYQPENINFYGWSMGAAVLAAALDKFNGYKLADNRVIGKDANFNSFVAEKTFTSIGDYLIANKKNNIEAGGYKKTAVERAVSFVLKWMVRFAKWDYDTLSIWEKLPVAHSYAINKKEDGMIQGFSGLATQLNLDKKNESKKAIIISDKKQDVQLTFSAKGDMKEKSIIVKFEHELEDGHADSLCKNEFPVFLKELALHSQSQKQQDDPEGPQTTSQKI